MPTLPVRQLGAVGVVSDASPYDLPINAFSNGSNIIFDEGKIQRAPVFKTLFSAFRSNVGYSADTDTYASSAGTYDNTQALTSSQRFVGSYNSIQYSEVVVVADTDGQVREYPNGNMSIVSPTDATLITNDEPWAHTQNAGLSILSRKDMRPYVRNIQTEGTYGHMRNDWVSNHTCMVVRGYLDFLIALNVTKGSTEYPSMVKWCNPLPYSPDPDTEIQWDPANTSYIAGENILGDLRTPLLDGLPLHNVFVMYSSDQVWVMEYTGSEDVFNFRRLFPTGGILGTNCVTEVEGKHFVFGIDDIYVHDGISKKSIADERIRRRLFQTLDRNKTNRCFVHHDSVLNLIYFSYVSLEDNLPFKSTNYANRAAVYNYRNDTWSFMDLPNVAGAAESTISLTNSSYEGLTAAYNTYSNIFAGFENETPRVSVMLGIQDNTNHLTGSRVYAVDLPTVGLIPLPVEAETTKPSYVERLGIDLDKETQFELRAYKMVRAIMPQVDIAGNTSYISMQIGGSDNPNAPVNWGDVQVFDHRNDYKMDTRASGRYLNIRWFFPDTEFFKFPAFDVEVLKLGKR